MKRRMVLLAIVAVVGLLVVPSVSAQPGDPFRGTWHSVDVDGSRQWVAFGGTADARRVVLHDTFGAVCTEGGAFMGTGFGTIDGASLTVTLTLRCVADTPLIDEVEVTYTFDGGELEDSFGAVFGR